MKSEYVIFRTYLFISKHKNMITKGANVVIRDADKRYSYTIKNERFQTLRKMIF